MPYSVIVNGKVVDIKYKKVQDGWHQSVWLEDMLLGQIFNLGKQGWSVVSWKKLDRTAPVYGFKSRRFATDYLLKLNGYN